MKKMVISFLLGFLFWGGFLPTGYPKRCTLPKIVVQEGIVDQDAFIQHLTSQHPQQSAEVLRFQIREAILSELREYVPGVELVAEGLNTEYLFSYILSLIVDGGRREDRWNA